MNALFLAQSCPDARSSSVMRIIKMHHLCVCVSTYMQAHTIYFSGQEYNHRNYFFFSLPLWQLSGF